MHELSEEQQIIFENIKNKKNVIVDACAGTGKTTLILATAKLLIRRKFLLMAYNASLSHESKQRVKECSLKNVTVNTFHSLAVKYYDSTAYTDTGIRYILFNDIKPKRKMDIFDILVLDEAQDMSFLYFQFICKFIKDMGYDVQLFILGDFMQGLYEFKGSDIRFLTLSKQIWENHPMLKTKKFAHCTLKMSYRITNQMCSFVNNVLLGENRMQACRDGIPVHYACNNSQNLAKIVFGEITKLLEQGASPGDFFILGGSVKGVNSNIRQLENILVERGIPCHVPMLDNDKIDERVIDGKVVFSTFHCVKGRQRKYVFVVGFDNSYLKYNARNTPSGICPNTLYVACTRATHGLYLLEKNNYNNDRPLDFLKMTHNEMKQCDYINFRGTPRSIFYNDREHEEKVSILEKKHIITPTELIKFIPESVIEEIAPLLDKIFITVSTNINEIDIPTIIETHPGQFEEISDLNGIAIPCMYFDKIMQTNSEGSQPNVLYSIIENNIKNMKQHEHQFLKDIVASLPQHSLSTSDYLYIANVYIAVQEKLYFKLKQINMDKYCWLSENIVNQCNTLLDDIIGNECQTEKPRVEETIIHQSDNLKHFEIDAFLKPYFEPNETFRFTARVDLITSLTLWEIKCTSQISLDHKLQTIIYAWLWRMLYPDDSRDIKILNIKTGEIIKIEATNDELNQIMLLLLKGKFQKPIIKTDEEFLNDCHEYLKNI
jgi:hypothetical protein